MKDGVRPYFNWVKLKVTVHSNETAQKFERLKKNVKYRCPVINLLCGAQVDVIAEWTMVPE